jgi:hypothetical protein
MSQRNKVVKRKGGKFKAIAITLACILALGAVGGVIGHIVNNNYNPLTIDGTAKKVVGFTGLTNSNGVLTYTGNYAKYNEIQTQSDDDEDEEVVTEDSTTESVLYTLKKTGEFVELSSPLDKEWPYSEIKTVKDKYNNSFTQFPKMYMSYSYNRAGYLDGVSFANYKVDDSYFINDCYLKQDGSGTYSDYFYIGQFEASGSTDKLYSVPSATPLVNITREEGRTAARAYGSAKNYYNGYQQLDITMWDMYALLVSMYLKTDDVQSVYAGPTDLTSSVTTGTTAPISTMNGWNTSTHAVKFLGVENAYGSVSEWCDGINFSGTEIFYQSNPNNFTDTIDKTSDVIIEFERPTTTGYTELLMTGTSDKTQSVIYPAFSVASESEDDGNYEDDYYGYSSTGTVLSVGGSSWNGAEVGLFFFNGIHDSSYTSGRLGSRLCGRSLSGVS